MLPNSLTSFEIQKSQNDALVSSKNDSKSNVVYSSNNTHERKDGTYVINLDKCANIRTLLITIYVKNNVATYFDSFGVEHIPKEIRKFICNKKIIANIHRIKAYDPIFY